MSNEAPTDALRLVPVPYVVLSEAAGLLDCEGYGPLALTLNNLLAAAPASPLPGGGWQDISTAPRTGEEFQAWWKGTWQPRARFDPEYGSFQLWGRTDFDTEGWEVFEIEGYWQPQPAAPTGGPK